eukprot:s267_g26.t1
MTDEVPAGGVVPVVSAAMAGLSLVDDGSSGYVPDAGGPMAVEGGLAATAVAQGGVVPLQSHPHVDGGSMVGHGGVALQLYVGMSPAQAARLMLHGHCEAPRGKGGANYWPLKARLEAAVVSAVDANADIGRADVVTRPVSVTFVWVLAMIEGGQLCCMDAEQWRLYAPLQLVPPMSMRGCQYYQIHDAVPHD